MCLHSFRLPDLSGLDDRLTANYLVSLTIGRGFPPGGAQQLVTSFVRCTEGTLRRYEEARVRLARSVAEDSLTEYLRGTDDMELTFMALHRTMRHAERLSQSPETRVGKHDLPPQCDRDLLRKMRNAIDHADEPIVDGHAGKGRPIRLHVASDGSTISRGKQILTVEHARFAAWVQTLHSLAVGLTNRPQDWLRA
jgi:hypothetical protein